jgi:hypothetical protein
MASTSGPTSPLAMANGYGPLHRVGIGAGDVKDFGEGMTGVLVGDRVLMQLCSMLASISVLLIVVQGTRVIEFYPPNLKN